MSDPFAQLESAHRRQDEMMRELRDAIDRDDPTLLDDVLHFLGRAVPRHFADEEESLFPRVPPGDEITALIEDHRAHEELVERLRDGGDDRAALATELIALHAAHVEREDRLFPNLRAHLSAADLDAMVAEMESRRGRGGGRR